MAYLEYYGEGVDGRIRIIKLGAALLAALVLTGGILFFLFHNAPQERQGRRFLELLAARDYEAAYALWVRTPDDRRAYPMQSFLEDWGPQSGHPDFLNARILKSRSCGSGVILTIDSGLRAPERLWIERETLSIGFAPSADLLPKICNY